MEYKESVALLRRFLDSLVRYYWRILGGVSFRNLLTILNVVKEFVTWSQVYTSLVVGPLLTLKEKLRKFASRTVALQKEIITV